MLNTSVLWSFWSLDHEYEELEAKDQLQTLLDQENFETFIEYMELNNE